MSKQFKKGKPAPKSRAGQRFDGDALAKLTSKLDQSLASNDHKRKQPPTNTSKTKDRKRPRNSAEAPTASSSKIEDAALLEEIKALGGDEKDLELIRDIDSSDDDVAQGQKQPMDKRLRDEVAAFSKELGLTELAPSEASDASEDETAEGDDGQNGTDAEEASNLDEDEGEDEVTLKPRKAGDMVSRLSAKTDRRV
jgi:ribosome biogenesis protein MAK21